jgi:mannose-6-phosphate isomerase-like protein (cupin superfamily)
MKLNQKLDRGTTGIAMLCLATALAGCHGSNLEKTAPAPTSSDQAAATAATEQPIEHLSQVSLIHLGEQPVQPYPWGEIRWLMGSKIDPQSAQTFGIVRINAGQKNALHLHPNCEELLYVLSGTGESIVADKTVQLRPGDLVRIPAHVWHQATATGKKPLIAVISYSSADRQVVNRGTSKE